MINMERKFSAKHSPEELNLSETESSQPDNTILDPDNESSSNPVSKDSLKPDVEQIVSDNTTTNNVVPESDIEKPEDTEIDYTLESVSQEIDQFMSSLSLEEKDDSLTEEKDPEEGRAIPVFVEKFLHLVEDEIAKREANDEKEKRWCQDNEDDKCLLNSIQRVSKLNARLDHYSFKSDQSYDALINCVGRIQQRFMSFLEEEFRMILKDSRSDTTNIDPDSGKQLGADQCTQQNSEQTEEEDFFLGYSENVTVNLNRIAKEMIERGFESECCQIYMIVRRQALDECLSKIGFESISIDEVQKMHWEALEREIPAWIKTYKGCATIYFSKERNLAEAVFADYPSISSSLFSNLTRGVVIQLLNFAEGIAMTKRSAEKVFKFLDMYEALRDSISTMEGLFPEECQSELKTETMSARSRIGEAAICIFSDLENSIKSDTGKTPVSGGAVHPLTRYTMNYLKYTCEYKTTLEQVFREHSKIERADSTSRPNFQGGEAQNVNNNNDDKENQLSPFSKQLMRVMDLLDSSLAEKAKLYKDIALSCIFMMNNGRYILQKIKGSSEIHQVMGDTWSRKKSSDLRNYHKNYQRETWNKILGFLGHEGLQVNGKVQKPVLKDRFKSFNMMFDEIHKTQSTWIVSDEQLQSELRVSISAVMIPAYRSFLGRFSQFLDPGRRSEKYIKYQPEDIETMIDELFDGNPTGMARRKP